MKPRFTPLVEGLPATVPFVGPEALERRTGVSFAARLGANENGFGPSPHAIAAMQEAVAREMAFYPDSTSHTLRAALAERHGLDPARISVGEGIDGLLGNTVRLFVAPGTPVVTSAGAYPTFNYHVAGFGGELITVPYRDDRQDPAALAAAVLESGARLVYFCNPDNPMGSHHGPDAVQRLLDGVPQDCVVILDEAYVEYAPQGAAPGWDLQDPRVIRFRTFSKAFGLAGLRIAWAIGDQDIIAGFERIRNHFGVNRMAQVAAEAALADEDYLARTLAATARSRARIFRIAADNGLTPLPSATNFVAIDCGRDGAFSRAVVAALGARGVFIRMPGVAPLDRCIRVSCGPEEAMTALERALPPALAEAETATARAGAAE